jgi:hypothetical protein
MHCSGYDTYPDTASTTGVTSVDASLPTFNLSLTNQLSHGTSNPSSAEGMKLSGHTSNPSSPEVTKAVVIEDFYRGSNDSAFVRAILQKATTTS